MLYIDNSFFPNDGIKMCNLTADTIEELHSFARKLGVDKKSYVDIFISRYKVPCTIRKLAIELGATAVQYREEPWRCADCHKSTLPSTRFLKCKCKESETKNTP